MKENTSLNNAYSSFNIAYPPCLYTTEGKERKVGFEIEFAGNDLESCAHIITCTYGGTVTKINRAEFRIEGTSLGSFRLEIDSKSVKAFSRETQRLHEAHKKLQKQDSTRFAAYDSAAEVVAYIAGKFVPFEVISSPLYIEDIPKLEWLRDALRHNAAKGTKASLLYAFGLHINPELPSLEAHVIRDYLKAFLLLYDWLKVELNVDIKRRITPYIDPFKEPYVKLVIDPAYKPDTMQLITDYLAYNPTRNRALDMLPLFTYMEPELVVQYVQDERIKPRPTFHYRLPNCDIDNGNWTVTQEWNYWVEVERLAEDKNKLAAMAEAYLHFLDQPLHTFSNKWYEQTHIWLKEGNRLLV